MLVAGANLKSGMTKDILPPGAGVGVAAEEEEAMEDGVGVDAAPWGRDLNLAPVLSGVVGPGGGGGGGMNPRLWTLQKDNTLWHRDEDPIRGRISC